MGEIRYKDIQVDFTPKILTKKDALTIADKAIASAYGTESNSGRSYFHIPDIFEICEDPNFRHLKDKYIQLYKNTVGNVKGADKVAETEMIAQALLFDGPVAVFRTDTNDAKTAESAMLSKEKIRNKSGMQLMVYYIPEGSVISKQQATTYNNMDKLVMANRGKNAKINAYILKPKYVAGTGIREVDGKGIFSKITLENATIKGAQKLTVHRKGVQAGTGVFIPYVVICAIMARLRDICNNNLIDIAQQGYGVEKRRLITGNKEILRQTGIDKDVFAINEKIECFPMTGVMYVPVVGAPSLTVAKERVALADLIFLQPISVEQYVPNEIVKNTTHKIEVMDVEIDDAVYMLKVLCNEYYSYAKPNDAPKELKEIMRKLHISRSDLDARSMAELLNSLSKLHEANTFENKYTIIENVQGLQQLVQIRAKLYDPDLYDKDHFYDMTVYDGDPDKRLEEITRLLNKGVCRMQYLTDNLNYTARTCTRNRKALSTAYGADYYWKLQSKGHIMSHFFKKVKYENVSITDALREVCLDITDPVKLQTIASIIESIDDLEDSNDKSRLGAVLFVDGYRPIRKSDLSDRDEDEEDYKLSMNLLTSGIPGHVYVAKNDPCMLKLSVDKITKIVMLKEFD